MPDQKGATIPLTSVKKRPFAGNAGDRLSVAHFVESAPGQAWRSWKSCEGEYD
jgi:hypothetical protein